MTQEKQQFAETGMLIRKPVGQVFEAFIDPEITRNFWFSKSTGRLDENDEVLWTWEMYNHSLIPKANLLLISYFSSSFTLNEE
jgi:uncharacterized protein YndB with AHSA1/START domain